MIWHFDHQERKTNIDTKMLNSFELNKDAWLPWMLQETKDGHNWSKRQNKHLKNSIKLNERKEKQKVCKGQQQRSIGIAWKEIKYEKIKLKTNINLIFK